MAVATARVRTSTGSVDDRVTVSPVPSIVMDSMSSLTTAPLSPE